MPLTVVRPGPLPDGTQYALLGTDAEGGSIRFLSLEVNQQRATSEATAFLAEHPTGSVIVAEVKSYVFCHDVYDMVRR